VVPLAESEYKVLWRMCALLQWEQVVPSCAVDVKDTNCETLGSALSSAKTTLPKGSARRVFVQDLAASLNRKGVLWNEDVKEFEEAGYAYMEAEFKK